MLNSIEMGYSESQDNIEKDYGEILRDETLVFHGIGFNLTSLKSIL